MDYILVFVFCFLTTFSLFSYGFIFNKFIFKFTIDNYSETIFIGVIVLTFIALTTNFISSLNPFFNSILFFISLILFFFIKEINVSTLFKNLFTISLIGFVTFLLDSSNRPDAGLYHLPFISMLNEHEIILGSVNLHFRFGHVSSLQYLSSLFNNYLFKDNGILIPLTIIYATTILFFLEKFTKYSENNLIKLYSFFSIIFILTSMNRYSEFGNDDPAVFFFLLTIFYFLSNFTYESNRSNEIFSKILLFSSLTFLTKQFYALIIFFPIYFLCRNFKNIKLINNVNIFSFLLVSFWLIKNLLTTACVIYPLNFTCISSLPWSTHDTKYSPMIVTISSEAWAKSFPDRKDPDRNEAEHLSDNQWISGWLENHLQVIINNLIPLLIISLIVALLNFKKFKTNIIHTKSLSIIFYFNLLFSIYWFLKFPTYRYGAGYLGTLIIAFILIIYEKIYFKKSFNKTLSSLLIVVSIVIIFKNFNRIIKNYDNHYVDYPWPKKNSFTIKNLKNTNIPVIQDNEIIYYYSHPYPICMYSSSPCTHFRNSVKKINILKNYKLFIPK